RTLSDLPLAGSISGHEEQEPALEASLIVIESNQRVPVARRRKLTVSGTGKALILSVEGREQPIALLDVSEGGVLLQEPDDRRVAVVRDGIVRARQWGYSHGAAPSLGDAV